MKLGTEVYFTAVMEKQAIYEGGITNTNFVSQECSAKSGIYIGYRHISIGRTIYYPDDGPTFKGKGCVKVLLVVCSERTKPIMTDPIKTFPKYD